MKPTFQFPMVLFFLLAQISFAAKVTGSVFDARSGEALVGTSVFLKNTSYGTSADLDGSFEIKNVPIGEYTLVIQLVGYNNSELTISVKSENEVIRNTFKIEENISLLGEGPFD